jgi:hypothetical protein
MSIPDHVNGSEDAKRLAVLGAEREQVSELRSLTSALIDRLQYAQLHGLTFNQARDLYKVLGYSRILTSREYGERYARGGIAGRIVDVYPNATWRGGFDIVEDENPHEDTVFEKAWKDFGRKHQIVSKLLRVDKLSLLSTYAVLLLGAPNDLHTELPKSTPGKLLYLTPYSGGGSARTGRNFQQVTLATGAYDADVSVYELETDPQNERFGLPRSYYLRRTELMPDATMRPVHWSRVIHVAEGVLWDEINGMPALERVWNLIDDLEKVTGGGAEAFWLRANQGLHLDIDKDMQLPDAQAAVAALKEQAEEYKHQLTRWLRTRGVTVSPLGSDVANFSSPADAILTQIAGAKGIPKRILTGSEMGELASSQDRDNWKDQINGRQTQYAGPYIIRPLIDRLIKYGYLPTPAKGVDAYEVKWPQMQVLTEQEKADGASKWAETNSKMGEVVYTNDEIRSHWHGFEPLTPEQKKSVAQRQQEAQSAALPTEKDLTREEEMAAMDRELEEAGVPQELVGILEAAIAVGNTQVIDEILGLGRA